MGWLVPRHFVPSKSLEMILRSRGSEHANTRLGFSENWTHFQRILSEMYDFFLLKNLNIVLDTIFDCIILTRWSDCIAIEPVKQKQKQKFVL